MPWLLIDSRSSDGQKHLNLKNFASEFERFGCFFPNVIGAINGLHVEMECSEEQIWAFFHQLQSFTFMTSSSKFSTLPKKSIFSIGKFSQHIHRVLIQVFFWISNETYFNSVQKKLWKMFTLLLYQVKIYYLKRVIKERKLQRLLIYVCQIEI